MGRAVRAQFGVEGGRGQVLPSLLVGLVAVILAWTLRADWLAYDGVRLVDYLAARAPGTALWHHVLYVPAAECVMFAFGCTEHGALLLTSALSLGVLAAASGCVALSCGLGLRMAALAALVVASAPAGLFHGTIVEVHALHAAHVAVAVAVVVRTAREESSRLRWWALAMTGSLMLSHRGAFLAIPALVHMLERPRSVSDWCRSLALAGALVAAGAAVDQLLHEAFGGPGWLALAGVADKAHGESAGLQLWSEVFLPLGMVLPLALFGVALDKGRQVSFLIACTAYLAGVLAFGVATAGGYVLPLVPFAVQPIVRALKGPTWRTVALVGAALSINGFLAASLLLDGGRESLARSAREREHAFHRASSAGATLLSIDPSRQPITGKREGDREFNLVAPILELVGSGAWSAESAGALIDGVCAMRPADAPLYWSREWRDWADVDPRIEPIGWLIEDVFSRDHEVVVVAGPEGEFWRLH